MPGGVMSPEMMNMQLNQFANQQPEQMAQIKQAVMESMQAGELTPQELNMMVQLATVASQNPEMYPNVRRFAIQQGIATEQDLPQQYDAGLVFTILLAARAVQSEMGGGGMPQAGPVPSMAQGGKVPPSRKSDGSVLINAHEGEYVIPANVVKMKGKEFFDSMVEKYKEV
jgi:deferrochelatase/peroxidase EfeB